MNKKGLGLSIGLASVIAVGTFVSPYLSSTTLIGDNNVESNKLNDSKYSVAIKSNDVLTPNAEKEEKEKALNEIRNSQVRNVLNDSTRTISKESEEEINSEVKEVKENKQELKASIDNNVSTYKQNSEKVDTKKDEAKIDENKEYDIAILGYLDFSYGRTPEIKMVKYNSLLYR